MKKIQMAALATFVVLMVGLVMAVRIPLADQKGLNLGLTVTLVTFNVIFVVSALIVFVDRMTDR